MSPAGAVRAAIDTLRQLTQRTRRTEPTVSITPYPDGPLLVRGDFDIRDSTGQRIDPRRRTVALCRCGCSATKPFCDGTHKVVGFEAPVCSRPARPRKVAPPRGLEP